MKPLWARPKGEIEEESEYVEFYKHLTRHDWKRAARHVIHFHAEGTLEYTALLYLPSQRPMDLFDPEQNKSNALALRAPRADHARVRGPASRRGCASCAVSSSPSDLPLNVSRETLQDNPRDAADQASASRSKVLEDPRRACSSQDREKPTRASGRPSGWS